jgi:hypothetical protein
MKTSKIAVTTGFAMVFAATLVRPASDQYELLLAGPVESVNLATNTITVLGHRIAINDASTILPGHKINVFGKIEFGGSTRAAIVQDTNTYAGSGDQVLLIGKVDRVDRASGRLLMGGASVDYTALLAQPRFALPAVGNAIRITGTQPYSKGVVLASEIATPVGVIGSTQAAGVIGSTQAAGVIASTRAAGVIGSTQVAGVIGSTRAAGVIGSTQAAGVIGSTHVAGVIGSTQSAGVIGSTVISR